MGRLGIDDIENLRSVRLGLAERDELLAAQTECTFCFRGPDGWPSGVIMSFLLAEGHFWFTSVAGRPQVDRLAEDARVSLVVTNAGTDLPGRQMLTLRGTAVVHRDAARKDWFFGEFTRRHQPADPAAFRRLLDSPNRVVIEVTPTGIAASHDSRRMPGNGRGGVTGS
ncbi:pyridoxamine 5'-phosphate oxidase family protein [Granulicoccus phenolivorans]|uniref:pyridoxamine 5'-phosphate oxidase family protein n=1 Tax=Granulicoccus phenolivorans TaxID=266854 RepID=UPI00040C485A|nr:pyridoxamine 5'-phosphate oxidase family protein [Granulicoccus phenolivorans]